MFTVYHSNQIEALKNELVHLLRTSPNRDPFTPETVLVQSLGMAQWLQMKIAENLGVAGNLQFPYPTSFLWQQYRTLFPDLPKENIFARQTLVWHLMRIIPSQLAKPSFEPLKRYLSTPDQLKLYQLSSKVADLFDQYLVYRPHWLVHWENGNLQAVLNELKFANASNQAEIEPHLRWQSELWNLLVAEIRQTTDEKIFQTSHRAYLQARYFEKLNHLSEAEKQKLPARIFVFGISSMPHSQLAVLTKLSEHCEVHLFFANPCATFWGDSREEKMLEKMVLNEQISPEAFVELFAQQGNPLLATWGKQGREFLNLLIEQQPNEQDHYVNFNTETSLLAQLKQAILTDTPKAVFQRSTDDHSIQIHACHSRMREVEVLHNQLLRLFEQDPTLSPKDIIVMSADIDNYAPYIQAAFTRYERGDPRAIPFALSDQKISQINPIIASFLRLLKLKESRFSAEELLEFLDVEAIQRRYQLNAIELAQLRRKIAAVGIRAGLNTDEGSWQNYNAWQNGISRLLLGTTMKAEHQAWQSVLAFDESYGLAAESVGNLATFLENLTAWGEFIQQPQSPEAWHSSILRLIETFYTEDEHSSGTLFTLRETVENVFEQIQQSHFHQPLGVEVLATLFEQQLSEERNSLNFLVGKVNFCTLLPMRAIPFKVVCLLGMNEGDFPRQQSPNSFDLMQFAPQKGDRAKRDDDRYLFLEALLSAQTLFYVSYIGQSLNNSQVKLPSILVSQLQSYLDVEGLETFHPMSVFSPQNLTDGRLSYDREWYEVRNEPQQAAGFLQKIAIPEAELPTDVDLADLIAYLQNPIAFFCRKQLGISFEQYDEAIEENELFALSGLERYNLLDNLLKEIDSLFFTREQLKGNLPAGQFATLTENQLNEAVQDFRTVLADYLAKPAELQEIELNLPLAERKIRLFGNIHNRFEQEIVQWRVGKLRDKDRIAQWIYWLALNASEQAPATLKFYFQGKNKVESLSFQPMSQEAAINKLTAYLQDYLTGLSEPHLVINDGLEGYFKKAPNEENELSAYCQNALEALEDSYMQRALNAQKEIDYTAVHHRTVDWFEEILNSAQATPREA